MRNPNAICVRQPAYLGSRQLLGFSAPSWVLAQRSLCACVSVYLCVCMSMCLCVCVFLFLCVSLSMYPCCCRTSRPRTNRPPPRSNQPSPRSDLWRHSDHINGILCARNIGEAKSMFARRLKNNMIALELSTTLIQASST